MITDTLIRALWREAKKDGNDFLATMCRRALWLPELGSTVCPKFRAMCEDGRHECERVINEEVYEVKAE